MLLNVSCGFVLFSSLESLDCVLRILCILKESMVITAGLQYVFVEDIINSFFTVASNPEEIGSVRHKCCFLCGLNPLTHRSVFLFLCTMRLKLFAF